MKLQTMLKTEKLTEKFGHQTVQINISTILPLEGGRSYQIRWTEETFTISNGANKRSYQLILNTSSWYNPMVKWNYGQEEETEMNLREKESPLSNINGNVDSLNFDYKIIGESGGKIIAFDDGEKTILKFEKMPKRLPGDTRGQSFAASSTNAGTA